MLGCFNFSGVPWLNNIFHGGLFNMIIWGLFFFIVVYFTIRAVSAMKTKPDYSDRDRHDSLEILKIRFAKGEVNKDEFRKMKDVLIKS